jgi:predicted phage-related endonuclease
MDGMTPYVTGSAEWHAIRQVHVGSSEVACLFGVQAPYQLSEYALFHVKRGATPPKVEGERIDWGVRLEEIIAQAAAERQGWKIQKGGYVEDMHCRGLGASLDHVILEPNDEDRALGCVGPGALEVKNVDWLIHRASWVDDEPPIHIAMQLQSQLACTGFQWGAVGALVGGNQIAIYRFFARPALIAEIRRRTDAFWERVRRNDPPPVDGSDGASDVLRELYPEVIDDAVCMDGNNEWPEAVAEMIAASAEKKEATRRFETARNRVAALIEHHKRAYGAGYVVTVSVTPAKPERQALPGEIIPGRAETRRITAKEMALS